MADKEKKNELAGIGNTEIAMNNPKALIDFADTLKKFVAQQKLYTVIKGKAYLHVEAWEFTGASMGIFPVITNVERVETDDPKEYKYKAEVELRHITTNNVVGSGVAFCSNKESKKKTFEEYAVASMAQTRAVSKAYRNAFAWIVKMSGYEATPAEEMDGALDNSQGITDEITDEINGAKTIKDLKATMNKLTPEQKLTATPIINEKLESLVGDKMEDGVQDDSNQD